MKLNKKLLALLLTLSVIFTSFSVMAETPVTTIAAKEPAPIASTEYDILQTLGFIGEDIKILNADSAFTRAQFVGTLYKIAGFPEIEYLDEEITFADMKDATLYKNEVQYFYNAGYINGTSATTFSPAGPITYQQATKIIADVLGYKDFAISRYGNDMNAFVSLAQKLDLTHNMMIGNVTAPLTAQNAIILLYNAGRAKIFDPSIYISTGDIIYDTWNGEELISRNNNIFFGTGTMQSNGIVSTISSKPNKQYSVINGVKYFNSGIDLTGFVGFEINFHYRNDKGTRTLLWAGIKNPDQMLELKASDLEPDDPKYTMTNIVYKKGKKNVNAKLDNFCNVIYNNSLYNRYNISHIKPEMGLIRLLDTDFDNDYDLVVVEEYENVYAIKYSSELKYISDKYNNPIKLGDYENVKIYRDGKEITADEIGVNVVLTCVASINKQSLIIYVNTEVYTTKLNAVSTDGGETTLEFDDITTKLAPSYENLDATKYAKITPVPGRLYTIYLDKEGNVAEIAEGSDGHLEYAYVTKAYLVEEVNVPAGTVEFRLLLSNGSFVTARTRKKVKFKDGDSAVISTTGKTILDNPRLWRDVVDGVGNIIGTEIDEQVVRVTINEEGEITEFQFPYDNTANAYGFYDGKFSLDYEGSASVADSDGGYILAKRFFTNGTTIGFVKYNGSDLEEPYGIVSRTSFKPVSGSTIKVYDATTDRVAKIFSGEHNYVGDYNDMYAFLVESVVYKQIDGESVKHIAGWYGESWKEMGENSPGIIPATVKRGDLVRVAVTGSNKITKCSDPVHLADKPAPFLNGNQVFSYLYAINSGGIAVLTPAGNETTYGNVLPSALRTNHIPVKIYDVKNNEILVKELSDVAPLKAPEADGTFVPEDDDVMIFLHRYRGAYITDVIVVLY